MGHLRGESMLAATISAEEVEKMVRNELLLGEVGGRGETRCRTAREPVLTDRPSKSSSAKDDSRLLSQFQSTRPSKTSRIENLISSVDSQIEGFIPDRISMNLKLTPKPPDTPREFNSLRPKQNHCTCFSDFLTITSPNKVFS
jgi:hypothetical protein